MTAPVQQQTTPGLDARVRGHDSAVVCRRPPFLHNADNQPEQRYEPPSDH